MRKPQKINTALYNESISTDIATSQEQIDALARRLMPEIKKYFADEQVQQEFAIWQEKQKTVK